MTPLQREQFNRMRNALHRIAHGYRAPRAVHGMPENLRHGLDPDEYIEMAYENIQADAAAAVKGVRKA